MITDMYTEARINFPAKTKPTYRDTMSKRVNHRPVKVSVGTSWSRRHGHVINIEPVGVIRVVPVRACVRVRE